MLHQPRQGKGVQYPVGRNGAFPGHLHSPMHVIEFADRVRIRIDAENAPILERLFVQPPIEVKSPWMGINLNRNAMFCADLQDPFYVDVVTRASLKLAPGHMAENCGVWICNCFEDALRLLRLRQFEAAMHARDDEVEALEDAVRVVE